MIQIVLTCLFFLLFMLAAFHDFLTFRIPNGSVFGIIGLGVITHLILWDMPYTLDSILMTLGVFAVGFALYSARLLGAGDVKLWSAATFWYGAHDTLFFCTMVAIMGGVLAGLYYFYGPIIQNIRHAILFSLEKKQKTGKFKYIFNTNVLNLTIEDVGAYGAAGNTMLPYGVAIFWGSIITYWIKG